MLKLDTLMQNQTIGTIKVDVEGFEAQVFSGAERVILRDRPQVLFEVNKGCANEENMHRFLNRGYHLYWFYAPTFGSKNEKLAQVNRGFPGDMYIVALPEERPPPFKLPKIVDTSKPPPLEMQHHPYLIPLRPASNAHGPYHQNAL
jgi:hypothetical protein